MARGGPRPGSGRPKGARSKLADDVRKLAEKDAVAAWKRVVSLLNSKDERVQLAAAQEVLNRRYGKPAQAVTGEGGEGPVRIVVETGVERAAD